MLQKMFPQKGERVPKLRFKGFNDEWKRYQLGDISDKVTEKNKGNVYSETFTNSAEHGIISQRDFLKKIFQIKIIWMVIILFVQVILFIILEYQI